MLLLRDPRAIMRSRMSTTDGYDKKYKDEDEALRIHSESKLYQNILQLLK